MINLVCTLGLLAALALASPAAAADPRAVANATWGSPCGGQWTMSYVQQIPVTPEAGAHDWSKVLGLAFPADCRFFVRWDLEYGDPERLCAVVVHEVGHLAGRGHTEDLGDVMNTEYLVIPQQCRTQVSAADARTVAARAARSDGLKLSGCRATGDRLFDCAAKRKRRCYGFTVFVRDGRVVSSLADRDARRRSCR